MRTLFLASAARAELLPMLSDRPTVDELADRLHATRTDRLASWLAVGVATGELTVVRERYRVRGRRARALAERDPVLVAHYRSVLDYQYGIYDDLPDLLAGRGDRADLSDAAVTIAQVSRAAEPFIADALARVIDARSPVDVLDAGCGTGVYLGHALKLAPAARGLGVDLDPTVVELARHELASVGLGARATLVAGDFAAAAGDRRFDLVLLVNSVYYTPPADRPALYQRLGGLLQPHGELFLTTMTVPGSVAAAHLDLMLRCQAGEAQLPGPGELRRDLRGAGFTIRSVQRPVPGEPFVIIRAAPR